ncbi:MAG: rRNA adenine N-6-methyltransferase family protein, partial [Candidatus Acidiferrales bacterium]
MSRQKLGQHFLSDISWRKRIAETLPAAPGSVWIEIGAGHGEMTELLAKRAHRVIAIETDATLVPSLRNRAARWSANVAEASATPGPPAKTPGPAATEGPPATAAASAATEVPTVEIV